MSSQRLKAAFIGHSFVKRFHNVLFAEKLPGKSMSLSMPTILNVDDHYSYIRVYGRSGAKLKDLISLIDKVGKAHPDVLVIDIGTNDICDRECDVRELVRRLMILAEYAQIGHGVRAVYFCNVLNRGRCREVSQSVFSDRKILFNDLMQESCESRDFVDFHKFSGFWKDSEGRPLEIKMWSADLIHPGPSPKSHGFRKYRRSIRKCMLKAVAKLNA